jgi:3-hydroxybutyryl-CoA dehydrogenase
MPARLETAAVIGTGVMGPGIALVLALGGLRATIVSRTPEHAAAGMEKARGQASVLLESELAAPEQVGRALELLQSSADLEGSVAAADLVVESGPENMEFKQELFARMDALAPAHAVLASNTSGLSITAISSRCTRPERVLTTHFWNPPHLIPLVEIVKGEKTSDDAAQAVRAVLAACGKTPVIVNKDRPGQLGNRLQMALVREAAYIVAEGIASAADVDTVARNSFGIRLPAYGILEHQDMVGLDVCVKILDYVAVDLNGEPRAPEYYRELAGSGKLGAKTGQGFYDWAVKSADEVKARRDGFVIQVLRWRRQAAARAQNAS